MYKLKKFLQDLAGGLHDAAFYLRYCGQAYRDLAAVRAEPAIARFNHPPSLARISDKSMAQTDLYDQAQFVSANVSADPRLVGY